MAIIQKTKNSFIGVFLSLLIAPFQTYNVMINEEKSKYSLFIGIIFYICLLGPSIISKFYEKNPVYIPDFIESFALIIVFTHLFFAFFCKAFFFITKVKSSIWRTFWGSAYLYSFLTIALLVSYGLNFYIDWDYYRLAFVDGINETINDNYKTYYKLLIVLLIIFTIINLASLMKSLAKTSYSGGFCLGILSIIPLTIALIFAITCSNYINENAREVFLQFLTKPGAVVLK